jgi:hypothetical protein
MVETRGIGLLVGMRRTRTSEKIQAAVRELDEKYLYGSPALKTGEATVEEVIETIQGSREASIPGDVPLNQTTRWDLPEDAPTPVLQNLPEETLLAIDDTLTRELGYPTERHPYRGVKRGNIEAPHGGAANSRWSASPT